MPVLKKDGALREWVGVCGDIHDQKVWSPPDQARTITGAQLRAARGILNWSVRDLADAAKISASAIRRLEETLKNALGQVRTDSAAGVQDFHQQQTRAPGKAAKISDVRKMADQERVKLRGGEMVPQFPLARLEVHRGESNSSRFSVLRRKP